MRRMGLAVAAAVLAAGTLAWAGQSININSLPAGARFCPAPGANNAEFMSSYFSIDAQTGVMTRHDSGSGPVGMTPEPEAVEQVLFVSPPISVANVYVPPVGGPALPPQTMATGVMPGRPVQYSSAPVYAVPQPAPAPVYAQVQYPPQPYAQVQYPPAQVVYPQQQAQPYSSAQARPLSAPQFQPLQQYPQTTAATVQRSGVATALPPAPRGVRVAR